jgi:hypothetical protein
MFVQFKIDLNYSLTGYHLMAAIFKILNFMTTIYLHLDTLVKESCIGIATIKILYLNFYPILCYIIW